MANTLYASFVDAAMAEKAAGALLDHGVKAEDLSLVQHESRYNMPTTVAEDTGVTPTYVEGEMTGATVDSPGVMGTGVYNPPATSTTTVDENYDEESTPPIVNSSSYTSTVESDVVDASDEDFGVQRNQAEYDRENAVARSSDTTASYDDNVEDDEVDSAANSERAAKQGISTTTAADAGHAAITGGAVGLGVGAVAALASLLIPGFGLIVGGGALATAIGGMVATTGAGAAVGAVTGFLKDQGVEEHVAQKYGETVQGGGAILAVNIPSGDVDEVKAREVLEKYGATNINTYALAENTKPYMA
jgi:hypothetical protein